MVMTTHKRPILVIDGVPIRTSHLSMMIESVEPYQDVDGVNYDRGFTGAYYLDYVASGDGAPMSAAFMSGTFTRRPSGRMVLQFSHI